MQTAGMTLGDAPGPRRQLRFALSMNGGVSLAVWIGGTVCEIDCLRRGEGFWAELLDACGYESRALVDVMTGASAGGLNAVLYAQSIRAGIAYDADILRLWEETAGIADLIKPARSALQEDRRAVLRGVYFRQQLLNCLNNLEAAATTKEATSPAVAGGSPPALAIFASATLATPNTVHYRDAPGAPVDEARSDAYFHVARRGSAERGLDGFVIEGEPDVLSNSEALASIGRATCSLPVLFEPILFTRDAIASRLIGAFTPDRPTAEVVDGGVVDNVPIARAIRAIASSPANTLTRRVLLYLHPDPSHRTGVGAEPRTAIAVGRSVLGKRSETLREDIDLLREHNAAVARRDAVGHNLLTTFVRTGQVQAATPGVQSAIATACLIRTATDPSSELPWHAPAAPRLTPLLDGTLDLSHATLERTIGDSNAAESLVAMRPRRVVAYLLRLVREVERSRADAGANHDVTTVKDRLYEILLLADLLHAYQLARFLGHGGPPAPGPSAAAARLAASRRELAGIPAPDGLAALTDVTWRSLATWDLSIVGIARDDGAAAGEPPTVALAELLMTEMRSVLDQLPPIEQAPGHEAVTGSAAATATVTLGSLQSGKFSLDELDQLLLPLAAEPIASDQAIAFVRVAGNVVTPASLAFEVRSGGDVGGRITGVQLRHLGAFFQRSWRRNDWWWGRLDSVPALLDAVLDRSAVATLRRTAASRPDDELSRLVLEAGSDDAALRDTLLRRRQSQLLAGRLGGSAAALGDIDSISATPEFAAWAKENRSLQHLLGTASLTSTALRAAVTAWKVLTAKMSWRVRALLAFVRPVLFGLVGFVLAGRRAVPTITITLCLLAASRSSSPSGRLVVFITGIVVALVVAAIVERKVRPKHGTSPGVAGSAPWLYAITVVFAAAGGVASSRADWVRAHTFLWAAIPPVVAVICALLLFFWMSVRGRIAMTALSGSAYALWSWNASRPHADPSGFGLQSVLASFPLRSMWVCWLVVIIVITSLFGRLPDEWLRPSSGREDSSFAD